MAKYIQLLRTKEELWDFCDETWDNGSRMGLVPTMGAIHAGHQSLVDRALDYVHTVVVSVFVNPTQFSPTEDFDAYPRTLEEDLDKLEEAGAAAVFAPTVAEMYGEEMADHIKEHGLTSFDFISHAEPGSASRLWEGQNRPHHFAGVTTVVAKLFNLVEPDVACFGEKDYQQLAVIRQMVRDMDFKVHVVGCPIVREESGLALSSRNKYLSADERQRALALSRSLRMSRESFAAGERDVEAILSAARAEMEAQDIVIDYVSIVDAWDLEPLSSLEDVEGSDARMLIAAKVGAVRLIDNASLS